MNRKLVEILILKDKNRNTLKLGAVLIPEKNLKVQLFRYALFSNFFGTIQISGKYGRTFNIFSEIGLV